MVLTYLYLLDTQEIPTDLAIATALSDLLLAKSELGTESCAKLSAYYLVPWLTQLTHHPLEMKHGSVESPMNGKLLINLNQTWRAGKWTIELGGCS